MIWLEWVLMVFLFGLFCYLRSLHPWVKRGDCSPLDSMVHDKPLRPLIVSEKVMLLNFMLMIPSLVYFIGRWDTASKDYSATTRYFFGLFFSLCVAQVVKLVTCRPRPNAIALETVAKEGVKPEWFMCDPNLESRQSFFSSHAMIGSFCSFFLVFLIQDVSYPKRNLPPSVLQLLLILLGLLPGMSQGISYWHHWHDVLVGYAVGIVAAAASYYGLH